MKPEQERTIDEVVAMLDQTNERAIALVRGWWERGDGVAVYQDAHMPPRMNAHNDEAHQQFASFGSAAAMMAWGEPPTVLPDTDKQINWRYCLQWWCRKPVSR